MKPETHLRLGVGEVLLGRYASGLEHLKKAGDVGHGLLLPGPGLREPAEVRRGRQGVRRTRPSSATTPRIPSCTAPGPSAAPGTWRRPRRSSPASQKLSRLIGRIPLPAGGLLAADGELAQAAAEFEKALSLDKDHNGALFELAYINDLFGNDDTAVDYYKRCTERPPVPLAAWINLGVLYEDEMRFREAEQCYRQVLAHDPNHPRARLFVKDCQASKGMYYDEEAEKGYTVLKQLLEIPVTDFELSVRSRNCLRKMNIRTLGDLTRTTEAALLASKNFGETSLSEIKEMMTSKGLRLGMALEGGERGRPPTTIASSRPRKCPPRCRRC